MRLFGPFITKLPEYELARHEDVPLPESSAEPYHCGVDSIDAKLFIPGQNLNGVMIPSTGEYNAISQAALSDKDNLVDQFNSLLKNELDSTRRPDDVIHENFELVSSNSNQVVCIRSDENCSEAQMIKRLSSRTIQTALDNHQARQIQEVKTPLKQKSSRWVFTASVHLSLTKEVNDAESHHNPLLDYDRRNQPMIEDDDTNAIEEEGVEVVPYLSGEENEPIRDDNLVSQDEHAENEHISVLYVKEEVNDLADID